jgi:hypothetical protein
MKSQPPISFDIYCEHKFCHDCLCAILTRSIVDESMFPPKCCEPIAPEAIVGLLGPDIVKHYADKKQEFATTDRTYCSDSNCSMFMKPENISSEEATGPKCAKKACTICRALVHGSDCPADEATKQILDLARENEWQRCSSCGRVISITTGCNHITFVLPNCRRPFETLVNLNNCICEAQFCYQYSAI